MTKGLRVAMTFSAALAFTFPWSRMGAQAPASEVRPRAEVPKASAVDGLPDPDYSVTLQLTKGYRWWIVPTFVYASRTRITATTPEDGKSQQWTGTRGQTATAWVLSGYTSVNLLIERLVGGSWKACPLTVRMNPMPSPDPTRRVSGNCQVGETGRTEISVVPSK